jgi:hypothetical protein
MAASTAAAPLVGQAGAALTEEQTAALQAYRQCLRDNGAGIGRGGQGRPQTGGQAPPVGDATAAAPAGNNPSAPEGLPGQGGPVVSIDPAVLQKAQDACASQLPAGMDATTAMNTRGQFGAGGPGGAGAGRTSIDPTVIEAYLSCLKDNGVVVTETTTTTTSTTVASTAGSSVLPRNRGSRGGGLFGGIDRTTPEYAAANEKCKVLLPNDGEGLLGGPNGGPPGGPSSSSVAPTSTVAG